MNIKKNKKQNKTLYVSFVDLRRETTYLRQRQCSLRISFTESLTSGIFQQYKMGFSAEFM